MWIEGSTICTLSVGSEPVYQLAPKSTWAQPTLTVSSQPLCQFGLPRIELIVKLASTDILHCVILWSTTHGLLRFNIMDAWVRLSLGQVSIDLSASLGSVKYMQNNLPHIGLILQANFRPLLMVHSHPIYPKFGLYTHIVDMLPYRTKLHRCRIDLIKVNHNMLLEVEQNLNSMPCTNRLLIYNPKNACRLVLTNHSLTNRPNASTF